MLTLHRRMSIRRDVLDDLGERAFDPLLRELLVEVWPMVGDGDTITLHIDIEEFTPATDAQEMVLLVAMARYY